MKKYIMSALLLLLLFPLSAFARKETVLVIESYHAEYPWDASCKEGLEEAMGINIILNILK